MKDILPRLLAPAVAKVASAGVVVVTGAQQTGKSTLIRNLEPLSQWPYLTLDTPMNRSLAAAEPHTLLKEVTRRITIDEVQLGLRHECLDDIFTWQERARSLKRSPCSTTSSPRCTSARGFTGAE